MSAKPRGGRGRLRRQSISTRGTLTPLSAAAVEQCSSSCRRLPPRRAGVRVVRAVYRVADGRRAAITTAGVFAIAWRISIGPRTHVDRAIADTVLVAGLILLVTNVGAPAQYLAAAP